MKDTHVPSRAELLLLAKFALSSNTCDANAPLEATLSPEEEYLYPTQKFLDSPIASK